MEIITCADCGYRASADYVAVVDACPKCDHTPFREGAERGVWDQGTYTYDVTNYDVPVDPADETQCEACQ